MWILNADPVVLALIATLVLVCGGVAYTEIRCRQEDKDYDWDI